MPDRLRWHRLRLGLTQQDVADRSRSIYIQLETGKREEYPIPVLDKLAALYQISIKELLDGYNSFLYLGQGRCIREHRQSLGLTKKAYTRQMGCAPSSLRAWEAEEKHITKAAWEKYFRDVIKL